MHPILALVACLRTRLDFFKKRVSFKEKINVKLLPTNFQRKQIFQESLHATSFLSLEYVHCYKLDPITWKRIGEEMILPSFALDDTRVVEIDKHQVSEHLVDTLSYDCLIEKASSESIMNLICPPEATSDDVLKNIYLHQGTEEHKLSTKQWKIVKIDEHTQT